MSETIKYLYCLIADWPADIIELFRCILLLAR